MYKEQIKKRLNEEFTKSDKKEIQKMIDSSFDDLVRDSNFEKKVENIVKSNMKIQGNKKLEKEITEITKNVITQLYRVLWVRRNFWKNSITNK